MKRTGQPSGTRPQEARPGQKALLQWVEPLQILVRGFDWQVGIWAAGLGWKMGHGSMTATGPGCIRQVELVTWAELRSKRLVRAASNRYAGRRCFMVRL